MQYLLGLIGLLLGFGWLKKKDPVQQANVDQQTVKDELKTLGDQEQKNASGLAEEEAKRKEINDKANAEKNQPSTDDDILNVFKSLK